MYLIVHNTNVRIIGTMHIIPLGQESRIDWISEAINWADDIYLEHDIRIRRSFNPRWLQMLLDGMADIPLGPGGVERLVVEKASHKLKFLETNEILDAFGSELTEEDYEFVKNNKRSLEIRKHKFLQLFYRWNRGEYRGIKDNDELLQPHPKELLFDRREDYWMKNHILGLMKSDRKILIMVGAAHLDGLSERLVKNGYTLKNIRETFIQQLDLFNNPSPLEYSPRFPPQNCIRYVGVPARRVDENKQRVICSCRMCNDWGDFS